ncbi:DgyrCDS14398 [Dimorphilus gyrociliatus]|uniref:DgyrCDS14398 n=1 Tax=Dimorphilus gyrociliatus TaxID=2664684 RepID=A0A7I8WDM7_9ANNE|nr:DgyrCDS14398 [Dimorphilus gyrociliatus]
MKTATDLYLGWSPPRIRDNEQRLGKVKHWIRIRIKAMMEPLFKWQRNVKDMHYFGGSTVSTGWRMVEVVGLVNSGGGFETCLKGMVSTVAQLP